MSPDGFVQQGIYEKGTLVEEHDLENDPDDDDNLEDEVNDLIDAQDLNA